MPDSILALFCHGDDFCQAFVPGWQQRLLTYGFLRHVRQRRLCLSEIMTIGIAFHTSHYRDFKAFYTLRSPRALARRVSRLSELLPLCRLYPLGFSAALRLPAALPWPLHGRHLCGRDGAGRLA